MKGRAKMGKREKMTFTGKMHSAYCIALAGLAGAFGPMAASAETETGKTVWIGGASGSVFDAANWDNGVPDKNTLIARFTNSVTFVAENKEKYWKSAGVELADGITVTDNTRNMPEPNYISDGELVYDIGEGSEFYNNYVYYGKSDLTLVKKGKGVLRSTWCGSGSSRFRDIDVREGTLYTYVTYENRLIPLSNLFVRDGAVVKLHYKNIVATNGPLITIDAGGLIDCNGKLQTWPGLAGGGTVTNASAGVRLTLEQSGKVFSGKIHGKLIIEPDLNFAKPGSYCVIGDANTLADAELEIVDIEGFETPIRFAAGIGKFFVKKFPARAFYDVNGNQVTLCNVFSRPGNQWYVDASRTEEQGEGDGTTPGTAFRTLKAAMENPALTSGDTVYALPGVYSNGVMGSSTTLNRVSVPTGVWLVSQGGAENTFILGDIATNIVNGYGCGTGAVRCVSLGRNSRLEGFTLTGGRVNTSEKEIASIGTGGGVYCQDQTAQVVDCVLSNNIAWRGGAGSFGTYIRCRAYDNRCIQIGAVWNGYCNLYNCVTDRNLGSYSYYSSSHPIEVVNCVFGPNDVGSIRATGTTDANRAHFRNCVFLSAPQAANSDTPAGAGSVFHRCLCAAGLSATYVQEDGCLVANFKTVAERLAFVGLGEDLRPLSMASRAIDAGNDSCWADLDFQTYSFFDLDGTPRIKGKSVDIGAFEYDWSNWRSEAATILIPDGGLVLEGVLPGANSVAAGGKLEFTIKRSYDSSLLCTGFTTNGVFVAFEDFLDGVPVTVDGDDFRSAVRIEAVYEHPTDWYVDEKLGDDANPGYLPNLPKKTLVDVMTNTVVGAGDTVWVAPGWYTNGVSLSRESSYDQINRVIVKEGVTLKSTHGPEVTFIAGSPSPEVIINADGCGPGAVRCVKLLSGAIISGFTLTNGFTSCMTGNNGYQKGPYGGGVSGGRVEDCIMRNCIGVRGGGAADAICVRCSFIDNGAAYIGSAANGCTLVNCFFSGNREGSYTALNCDSVRNCTFLANNAQAVHYSTATTLSNPERVCNSLILCKGGTTNAFTSCVFSKEGKTEAKWQGEGSKELPIAEMGLDEEGRPLSRTSAVVDAGDNAAYASVDGGDSDLDGSQRIYNGTIDVGCWEFDWRGDFTRILSRSIVAVDSASPSVTAVEENALRLSGDGASMEAHRVDSHSKIGNCSFTVKVTGAGTLSVFRDGAEAAWVEVEEEDGEASLLFKLSETFEKLKFSFAGEGYADVSKFTRHAGTVITVK